MCGCRAALIISKADVDYYTQVRGYKETEILEVYLQKPAWGAMAFFGRLRVTDQVTEYEIRRIHGKNLIKTVGLDLPAQIFETEGMWFQIPRTIFDAVESKQLDFMGGIHAMEHAAFDFMKLANLDILEEAKNQLGFRLSLDRLASATLGSGKTANGLQALEWWRQGKTLEIIKYWRQDVKITKDLYRYGKNIRHLLYVDKSRRSLRIPVTW